MIIAGEFANLLTQFALLFTQAVRSNPERVSGTGKVAVLFRKGVMTLRAKTPVPSGHILPQRRLSEFPESSFVMLALEHVKKRGDGNVIQGSAFIALGVQTVNARKLGLIALDDPHRPVVTSNANSTRKQDLHRLESGIDSLLLSSRELLIEQRSYTMASGVILAHAKLSEPRLRPQLWRLKFQMVYDLAAVGSVNERDGG
jgi:hypothetical protein